LSVNARKGKREEIFVLITFDQDLLCLAQVQRLALDSRLSRVRFLPEGFVGSEPRSETNLAAQDFVGMIRDHAAQ
jgi:hypothetical protein